MKKSALDGWRASGVFMLLLFAGCQAVDTEVPDPQLGPLHPVSLPTGQLITPELAPMSSFAPLNPGLTQYPDLAVGGAVTEALSPDGNTLYLHEGGTGALHAVDLIHQTVRSTKVASADNNPLAWLRSLLVTDAYAGSISRTAAVSPDGSWLYTVGAFSAPGGATLVHLPDLAVKGRWLPEVSLHSVWVSADGRTIYLLENGDQLRVLRTDGSLVAKLSLPAYTDTFIVPTIP